MRLFLALEIPHEIQSRLEDSGRALRDELPRARWVRAGLMHLTLVFLGDTDPALLGDLDRELGPTFAATGALELTVTGAGAFPPRGRARVLWARIESDGDLAGLQRAAAGAVEKVTGPLEDGKKSRGYHPHLTLARCRQPWPRWAVEKLVAGFGRDHSTPFRIGHGSLIESTLSPEGPRYRTVSEYPVGAPLPPRRAGYPLEGAS